MDRYQICVALDDHFEPNDVSADIRTDRQHPFLKHEVQIVTSSHGRAVLVLTFTAVDLWTAILTGMALVRQSGYVPNRSPGERSVRMIPYGTAGTNGARLLLGLGRFSCRWAMDT